MVVLWPGIGTSTQGSPCKGCRTRACMLPISARRRPCASGLCWSGPPMLHQPCVPRHGQRTTLSERAHSRPRTRQSSEQDNQARCPPHTDISGLSWIAIIHWPGRVCKKLSFPRRHFASGSSARQHRFRDRALPGQRDPQRPPREALLRAFFLIASEEEKRGCLAKRIGNICLISGQTKAHPFRKAELPGAEIRPPRKRRTWHCIPCQHTNTGADSHGKTFLKNFKNGLDL